MRSDDKLVAAAWSAGALGGVVLVATGGPDWWLRLAVFVALGVGGLAADRWVTALSHRQLAARILAAIDAISESAVQRGRDNPHAVESVEFMTVALNAERSQVEAVANGTSTLTRRETDAMFDRLVVLLAPVWEELPDSHERTLSNRMVRRMIGRARRDVRKARR